ncbi:MAG: hypothetical protein KC561_14910 [Myxococcales bacterium]|nr:hypothetical protein [Myxococcales bacterium]
MYKILGMLEYNQESDGRYPVPVKGKPGVAVESGDTNVVLFDCDGVAVAVEQDGKWKSLTDLPIYRKPWASVFVTDKRVIYAHDKYGKRGSSLVGHVRYENMTALAVHRFKAGLRDDFAALRILLSERDGPDIRLELKLVGRTPVADLGDDLLRRAIAVHEVSFSSEMSDQVREKYQALRAHRFNPEKGAWEAVALPLSRYVQ